jgi:hypothetical protein
MPTRRRVLRVVLLLVALGVAYVVAVTLLEIPFAPWARSFGLWPTLTGDWYGNAVAPDGRTTPIYLEIRHALPMGRCRGCTSQFEGRAKTCESRESIRDVEISGAVNNWGGTSFRFAFGRSEDVSGVGPGEVSGEWDHDVIRATADLVTYSSTATAEAVRGENPPPPQQIRYDLRRGTENEFLAMCFINERP